MSSTPFRTLYLHIGLEKTGTTSIQEFLETNRAALAGDGVFLPQSLGHKNHKMLAAYGFDAGSRDIAVTSCGIGPDEADMNAYRATLSANLNREISEASAHTAIISSEDLSRLFTRREVERVINLLRPFCQELKVIVQLRRQDLLASSRYYSLVLGGSARGQVLPAKGEEAPRYYDYKRTLDHWIDVVGADNVILGRFPENPKAEGFNSVERFCTLLGLDAGAYHQVKRQHISYDAVNQIVIQNYNVIKGGYDPEGMEQLMTQLAHENDRQFNHIPSASQARQFYERYRDDNLALLKRLGAEDQMFSDDFSMYSNENMRVIYQAKAIRRLLRLLQRQNKSGSA